jgi:hypothetical protein
MADIVGSPCLYVLGPFISGISVSSSSASGTIPGQGQFSSKMTLSDFHDQADAEWIVIRGPLKSLNDKWKVIRRSLWGHNDTPCGRLAPAGLLAARGLAARRVHLVFSVTIY